MRQRAAICSLVGRRRISRADAAAAPARPRISAPCSSSVTAPGAWSSGLDMIPRFGLPQSCPDVGRQTTGRQSSGQLGGQDVHVIAGVFSAPRRGASSRRPCLLCGWRDRTEPLPGAFFSSANRSPPHPSARSAMPSGSRPAAPMWTLPISRSVAVAGSSCTTTCGNSRSPAPPIGSATSSRSAEHAPKAPGRSRRRCLPTAWPMRSPTDSPFACAARAGSLDPSHTRIRPSDWWHTNEGGHDG